MQQPHLEPGDIELLLDGDEGFSVFPLRKHLAACDQCQAEFERARATTELLERLPHESPRAGFADRVMSQVQVYEPWHVTLVEGVMRLFPRQGPWRVLAGAGAGGMALSLSALAIWVSLRMDFAVYAAQLGWNRAQSAVVSSAGMAVNNAFGEPALSVVRDGDLRSVILAVTAFVVLLGGATIGLRRLIGAQRRRRN
jgi:hypothetical protein